MLVGKVRVAPVTLLSATDRTDRVGITVNFLAALLGALDEE